MKVTDYNEVKAAASECLASGGCELLDYLTHAEAVQTMAIIYLTNDQLSGVGQDWLGNLSVISSPNRIAIIFLGHHSYYKHDGVICDYDDIEEDMNEIRMCLDAALLRWQENFG